MVMMNDGWTLLHSHPKTTNPSMRAFWREKEVFLFLFFNFSFYIKKSTKKSFWKKKPFLVDF